MTEERNPDAPATSREVQELRAELALLRAELGAARMEMLQAYRRPVGRRGGGKPNGPEPPPDVMRASGRCRCGYVLRGHEEALGMCMKCWTRTRA